MTICLTGLPPPRVPLRASSIRARLAGARSHAARTPRFTRPPSSPRTRRAGRRGAAASERARARGAVTRVVVSTRLARSSRCAFRRGSIPSPPPRRSSPPRAPITTRPGPRGDLHTPTPPVPRPRRAAVAPFARARRPPSSRAGTLRPRARNPRATRRPRLTSRPLPDDPSLSPLAGPHLTPRSRRASTPCCPPPHPPRSRERPRSSHPGPSRMRPGDQVWAKVEDTGGGRRRCRIPWITPRWPRAGHGGRNARWW